MSDFRERLRNMLDCETRKTVMAAAVRHITFSKLWHRMIFTPHKPRLRQVLQNMAKDGKWPYPIHVDERDEAVASRILSKLEADLLTCMGCNTKATRAHREAITSIAEEPWPDDDVDIDLSLEIDRARNANRHHVLAPTVPDGSRTGPPTPPHTFPEPVFRSME